MCGRKILTGLRAFLNASGLVFLLIKNICVKVILLEHWEPSSHG